MLDIYDFVFIVLVYRNTHDLEDFLSTFALPNSRLIVVNSFYDDNSENLFRRIAKQHGADFISIPNKGYGFGNNRGIEYALEKYKFKYLVISNADIKIDYLNLQILNKSEGIIAPDIRTLTNKQQNPFRPYYITMVDHIAYFAYKHDYYWLVLFCCAIVKLQKIFFLVFKRQGKIFSAHGAFLILSYDAVCKLYPLYNEEVFLFGEESHLAERARKKGVTTVYNPQIKIIHKEDGSTSLLGNQYEYTKDSFIKFYEYWYK